MTTQTTLEDLCQKPTLTASTEKYAQLVHDSTTQLQQSSESILSALNLRSIAFTKLAHFESAIHDAKAMQQLAPSSVLGYIREADIYSEQGKQRHVIDICSKGLSMVNAIDTHYATLQRAKMESEQRQNTRIDFITQLPLDIVITTRIPVFVDNDDISSVKPCLCLHASNDWRSCVVRTLDGLMFTTGDEEDKNVKPGSEIAMLSRHTVALRVGQFYHGTWLYDLLRDNGFCSLETLFIDRFKADSVDRLLLSLKSIGNNLTHFCILQEGKALIPIADIPQSCPNLVALDIHPCNIGDFTSIQMNTWPKITTLVLSNAWEYSITYDQIASIGKRFPSLKKLQLYACKDVQALLVVLENYPSMNDLEVDADAFGSFDFTFSDQGCKSKGIGITTLSVKSDSMCVGQSGKLWSTITSVLQQHLKTLEDVKFFFDAGDPDATMYDIEYPRLKRLFLQHSGWWIPRKASRLEDLVIHSYGVPHFDRLPDAIPPNLKKLDMKMECLHPSAYRLYEQYLLRFVHYSQLEQLVNHFHKAKDIDDMLNTVHHLHQLQCLIFTFDDEWEPTQMQRFLEELGNACPSLTFLEIGCTNAPSTKAMDALKRLEHLEGIIFSIVDTAGDDCFWYAIDSFSQLKSIRVY